MPPAYARLHSRLGGTLVGGERRIVPPPADDVLRDLYVRGKYRDVILPMTVLRRLDAVLEDSKRAVLDMKAVLDKGQARQITADPGRAPVEG